MMQNDFFSVLRNLLYLIPHVATVVICFYFIIKKFGADSLLLLIGSLISFLNSIFQMVILPLLFSSGALESTMSYSSMMYITVPIYFIASILFTIGLFLLVRNHVRK